MARFGKDERREIEGFDRRQRNNLKRLIYNRIFRSIKNSQDVDTLDMARIAKLGAEVLDKIASVDLKEAQKDEIVRKILTATTTQQSQAPRGAPAAVAAVWHLFVQGDPDATKVVNDWLRPSSGPGSQGEGNGDTGGPQGSE